MRLVSATDLKALMELEGTNYNTIMGFLADGASTDIETYLNRELKKEARTKNFQGGSRHYWLPAYPVDSVATLTVIEDDITLVKDEDFFIDYDSGQIEFLNEVSKREPNILKITWTGGYAATSITDADSKTVDVLAVPDSIKMAMFIQTSYLFRRRKSYGIEVLQMRGLGSTQSIEGMRGLVPEAKRVIQKERRLPDHL